MRLAADKLDSDAAVQQVYDVCEGFFCPSLGSSEDDRGWMQDAGLVFDQFHDWTGPQIPCPVLAVKPADFKSPIPTDLVVAMRAADSNQQRCRESPYCSRLSVFYFI